MTGGNFISKNWKEQEKCFFENLRIIRQKPGKKAVHDLRVSVKKIRSYLRLKEKITSEPWQEQFGSVKILFKISGKQRDFEMSFSLFSKYQFKETLSLPSFKKFLQLNKSFTHQCTKNAALDFNEEQFRHFTNKAYTSLALLTNEELTKKIREYAEETFHKADTYAVDINKNAHEIRKLLKDLYYWLAVCPSNPAENLIELTVLNKLLQHLGDWQDNFIFYKKLKHFRKEYLVNNTTEAEAAIILEKKISSNKEELLKKVKKMLGATIHKK